MSGPEAIPVHRLDGRTRLRIRARAGDPRYFADVGEALASVPGVLTVRVSPRTASVLLEHDAPLEAIARDASARDLFEVDLTPRQDVPPLGRIYREVRAIDETLRERTSSEWDLETVAFYGLVAAGLYQIAKGSVLPAGLALLLQAAQLVVETSRAQAGGST